MDGCHADLNEVTLKTPILNSYYVVGSSSSNQE